MKRAPTPLLILLALFALVLPSAASLAQGVGHSAPALEGTTVTARVAAQAFKICQKIGMKRVLPCHLDAAVLRDMSGRHAVLAGALPNPSTAQGRAFGFTEVDTPPPRRL